MTGGVVPLLLLGLIITLATIVAALIDIVLRMKHELTRVHHETHNLGYLLIAHLEGADIETMPLRTEEEE